MSGSRQTQAELNQADTDYRMAVDGVGGEPDGEQRADEVGVSPVVDEQSPFDRSEDGRWRHGVSDMVLAATASVTPAKYRRAVRDCK